jgi:hypothetical protein
MIKPCPGPGWSSALQSIGSGGKSDLSESKGLSGGVLAQAGVPMMGPLQVPRSVDCGGPSQNVVHIRTAPAERWTIITKDPYARLWEMDTNRMSVSRPAGCPGHDPRADVILNEQNEPAIDGDRAPEKLFAVRNRTKLNKPTYKTLRALMDNYVRDNSLPEQYTREQLAEIDAFMDACFYLDGNQSQPRPMMKWVYERILASASQGGLGFAAKKHPDLRFDSETFGVHQCVDLSSYQAFRETARNVWFGLYDNHYNGRELRDCSAFEHIFVGETGNTIGGYHYWLKFHWDEGGAINPDSTVDYGGTAYGPSDTDTGMSDSNSATVSSSWTEDDITKFKRRGGFFVGVSPEWMIATGMLALFENIAFHNGADELPFNERNFRRVDIEGVGYEIATWRNTRPDGSRGLHLRSLWPQYIPPRPDPVTGILAPEPPPPFFMPWATFDSHRQAVVAHRAKLSTPE